MQPELIALTGNQGSGKDTVADYLCSRYGYVKLTYSDGIYEEVTSLTGVPSEVLRVREWKENAWALLNPMLSSSYPWLDRVEYFFKLKGKSLPSSHIKCRVLSMLIKEVDLPRPDTPQTTTTRLDIVTSL